LRILHLLSQRPDSTGSGIYIQALLREAAAAGHENFLLAGVQRGEAPDLAEPPVERCDFVQFDGVDIGGRIVGMSDVMPYASRRFRDLTEGELEEYESAFAARLDAAVARFAPDLIHSHHLWLLSSLARRRHPGLPLVANCHGSDLRQFRNCPHLRERVLAGCRDLDAVCVLSEAMRRDVIALYGLPAAKVHIVGAGYDHRLFRAGEKPAPDPVEIIYAGKLSRAKGVPWLLRALARVEAPRWRLHLVGSGAGPEADECRALAEKLGPRVVAHGGVPQPELAERLRTAHLFVLPSFFEGLPLVVVEALACGCAVVSTDLPGVRELVGQPLPPAVALVDLPRLEDSDRPLPGDEESFVARLAEALADSIEAIGSAGGPPAAPAGILAACRWTGVYDRIEDAWKDARSAR
jgi:glycosyltransferase involved in cell wall biosynthesis